MARYDHETELLDHETTGAYRRLIGAGTDRVARRVGMADGPFTGIDAAGLAAEISEIDLDRPADDPVAALDELDRIYLRDAVYFHHPRYLAHLNCPILIPALLGETMLTAINSSLDTWDQSAGATLIERRLIDWTAARIGFGPAADGVFTSGGTQSNLQALLLAREDACGKVGGPRPATLSGLRILATECGHFSVVKSAKLLGLGDDAVITVPCDRDRRMRPGALAAGLDRVRSLGLTAMAVVATAGTTDFGSIDPLPEIAAICREAGIWFHVDAAYGCGLLVSARRRHLLDGIEGADSVTVDYHKSFFQPVSSSAVIVRDRTTLRHATHHADYLNPPGSDHNQVDKSLQTTRRFDALKLWLTLRITGAEKVGALFDEVVDRTAAAWRLLAEDPRFQVVTRPRLSTLVFRYVHDGADDVHLDRANRHARAALASAGQGLVGGTVVDGLAHLKFTLLNPRTTLNDIRDILDQLAAHAREYLGRNHA